MYRWWILQIWYCLRFSLAFFFVFLFVDFIKFLREWEVLTFEFVQILLLEFVKLLEFMKFRSMICFVGSECYWGFSDHRSCCWYCFCFSFCCFFSFSDRGLCWFIWIFTICAVYQFVCVGSVFDAWDFSSETTFFVKKSN